MSLLIISLDVTIVNIALPAIGEELDAPLSGLQWTIDAYTLVLASLLVLAGSTADRIGRRKVFQAGLALFTLGSLLCSVAPSLGWLIFFRMLQAVGGSMLNPVAMSIITNTFTEPKERARAIGVWGAVTGFSMALGPLAGGVLVHSFGWRSIFWINVPVGIAAFLLAWRFIPESRADHPRRLDPVGQVLVLTVLAGITYAIIEGPDAGWTSAQTVSCFALGLAALGGLLWWEPRRAEPLIELKFFRSAPFSGATLIAVCAFAALGGFLFLNTLYLQTERGLSALHAGLYTLPMAAMTVIASPLSGRLVAARGTRLPLTIAGTAMALGMLPLTTAGADTPVWPLFLGYLLFGFGFGMVNTPITNTAVSGMPRAQAGVAAAIASTSRQVGSALGVAVIGAVVASAASPTGGHAGWWILFALGLAVLTLGRFSTGRWAQATAEHGYAEKLPA
ncbi:EmrB/QacA subfamily drug resistance transporter [Actinoplanes lutulentus]|uniref:EmrB/QacA subfamily drug resistance transporter n=1 Tax=Actinoplanes lutulentus TaxID=1287878 RepID=A0A327Z9P5_9ACTN|nr:MFS transporter [Actinoplanes lutulentus]MBB2949172.1 EmrB/QacA subfamily drug resistance transporter [Actinoplanes lutulentus]RAK34656.1 EmrB/QacA subfamily drug resistance transporter [Actinoplanes lutulentus]